MEGDNANQDDRPIDERLRNLRTGVTRPFTTLPSWVGSSTYPQTNQEEVDVEDMLLGRLSIDEYYQINLDSSQPLPHQWGDGQLPPPPTGLPDGNCQWKGSTPPPAPPIPPPDFRLPRRKIDREQPAGQFPFLRLPREIRDEIYSYLVLFDTPPVPGGAVNSRSYVPSYKQVSLDLSIFRVNKMIHEEASEMFFGKNIFVIRMETNMRVYRMDVSWVAPWESLSYYHKMSDYRKAKLVPDYEYDENAVVKAGYFQNSLFLPRRYHHLIREIRIEIQDSRDEAYFYPKPHPLCQRISNTASKWTLVAFVERIRPLLEASERNLKVNIHVTSSIFKVLPKPWIEGWVREEYDVNERLKFLAMGYGPSVNPGSEHTESDRLHFKTLEIFYREIIRVCWPLTAGPWEYNITMPFVLDSIFAGLKEETLKRCNQTESGDTDARMFEKFVLPLSNDWMVRRGRLFTCCPPSPYRI
ncbi:hypothetical protein TWF694_007750 [Orbilia ellipsospora]|uniref:F-box domain-containing protein n=1 Tax=Orbilia ellipsospora TaxID=2528407 RepID=A0AAV9XK44_9PEZI